MWRLPKNEASNFLMTKREDEDESLEATLCKDTLHSVYIINAFRSLPLHTSRILTTTMSKVLLYVYDLSNGLARQLSLPLTGKFIEGIWHTSVVVYEREVYYGQGILESKPGMTHVRSIPPSPLSLALIESWFQHETQVRTIECGTTEIPEETFNEYLDDLRSSYTAAKYHLLDFNCNSFTADVVGFLTGHEIPEWITSEFRV